MKQKIRLEVDESGQNYLFRIYFKTLYNALASNYVFKFRFECLILCISYCCAKYPSSNEILIPVSFAKARTILNIVSVYIQFHE